ncbi:MAG: TonB-dependent receptor [Myxococcales bacterium]|nr:TonB-dependent receptor [Myxococcales bacterium]
MLRFAGVLVLLSALANGAMAQRAREPEPNAEKLLITPPKLIRFVEAAYPPMGAEPREEIVVELLLTIDKAGSVTEALVAKSGGEAFDAAALSAARQFLFEPARQDWEPIASRIRYGYVFEMKVPPVPINQGWLSGTVRLAEDESPAGRVGVEVVNEEGELVRELVAGSDGAFVVTDLLPGTYTINILGGEFGDLTADETIAAGEVTEVIYRLGGAKKKAYSGFGETAVVDAPPREVVRRTIDKEELTRIPGTRGDALRAVELLPGVARAPFGLGLLIIRGSAPNDSETFIDGIPVPLIYHFGGIISVYNSYLLEQIDFYPGNFSARYGRRTGGILEVTTRDPAVDKLHGVAEFSFIDTFITAEGPINEKLSISGGFRRSLIDLVFPLFVPDDADVGVRQAPVYYDYQLKLVYQPTKRDRLRFSSYGSNDRLALLFEETEGDDPTIRGDGNFATRFYNNQIDWARRISDKTEQSIAFEIGPVNIDFGIGDAFQLQGRFLQTYSRAEWRYQLNERVQLIAGADLSLTPVDLFFRGPPPDAAEGAGSQQGSLATEDQVTALVDTVVFRPGLYFESGLELGKLTRLVLGVRLDYFSEIDAFSFDPRATTIFSVRPDMRVKLGVGIYSQPPEFQESDATIGNPDLEPIQSVHVGAGWEYDAFPGVTFDVEGFYKYLWDRPVPTQNREAPFFVTGGIGRIYGAEFLISVRPPKGRQYFGFLSYTVSRSERKDGPNEPWRLFDFDQTHILSASFIYKFRRNWEIGALFRLVSGNPNTPIVGSVYDALSDIYIPIDGRINSIRNPLFNQLDLRVQKEWIFSKWKLALFLDIRNTYNRQNQEGLIYNYDFSQSTPLLGLPIIPSLGLRGTL